ncbi:MAG: TolC family protein [Saprospiraceae bacterium]|nr:TolC family protein [Saprospiraceae bacterium]
MTIELKTGTLGLTALLFFVACIQDVIGQKPLSIEDAVRLASQHNRVLRSEQLRKEYALLLTKTSSDIPGAVISTENGQFNSAYFDTKLSISQSFELPIAYRRKKRWLETSVLTVQAGIALKEKEIRQQLEEVFNEFGYTREQEKLLQSYLKFYDLFSQKTDQRVREGEADIIEKTMATQQLAQVNWQLERLRNALKLLSLELSWLVNDGSQYVPDTKQWNTQPLDLVIDSSQLKAHPQLQLAYHQWQQAVTFTALQRSMLLPSVTIGFNNMSIRGTGADNVLYDASKRFSSFQLGIQIPLFRKSANAGVSAARAEESIQRLHWENEVSFLWKEWLTLAEKQQLMADRIRFMDQVSLPNAATIKETASRQLSGGAINYLEFVTLMNQALNIEQEYISIRKEANSIRIAILFLM